MDYIFVVNHSNLRTDDGSMLADAKHITQEGVRLFVGNIKSVLRKVYGIPSYRPKTRTQFYPGLKSDGFNVGRNSNEDRYRDMQNFKRDMMNMLQNF